MHPKNCKWPISKLATFKEVLNRVIGIYGLEK